MPYKYYQCCRKPGSSLIRLSIEFKELQLNIYLRRWKHFTKLYVNLTYLRWSSRLKSSIEVRIFYAICILHYTLYIKWSISQSNSLHKDRTLTYVSRCNNLNIRYKYKEKGMHQMCRSRIWNIYISFISFYLFTKNKTFLIEFNI